MNSIRSALNSDKAINPSLKDLQPQTFNASQSYFFPRVRLVGGPITSEIQDWILIEMSALGLLSATTRHDDAHTGW